MSWALNLKQQERKGEGGGRKMSGNETCHFLIFFIGHALVRKSYYIQGDK